MQSWKRPDCPAMEVLHFAGAEALRDAVLVEVRQLDRALRHCGSVAERDRLRGTLCNRLELLARLVAWSGDKPPLEPAG